MSNKIGITEINAVIGFCILYKYGCKYTKKNE